jgi:hypothetical protein
MHRVFIHILFKTTKIQLKYFKKIYFLSFSQRRFANGPHKEEEEDDDHEGPGPITSRRPWQPGTLMSKIYRTVRGGEEVARNVRKGCRTLDEEEVFHNRMNTTGFNFNTNSNTILLVLLSDGI